MEMFDVFVGQPSANSTDYKSAFDDMEASVKLLDDNLSRMEVSMGSLERSEKRSRFFMGLFAVTILLLCCSMGYNFYLTAGLKAEVQVLSKVKFGSYEEETNVKGKLSVKTGLISEQENTLPAPPVQKEPVTMATSTAVPASSALPTSNFRKRYYRPSKQ